MAYEFTLEPEGYVLTWSGHVMIEELERAQDEGDELVRTHGLRYLLADYRPVERLDLSVADTHRLAARGAHTELGRVGGRMAIVGPTGVAKLADRFFRPMATEWVESRLEVQVFTDEAEARRWLDAPAAETGAQP